MFTYYKFTTWCGIALIAALAAVSVFYILLLVGIDRFFGSSVLNDALLKLAIAVAVCFFLRGRIKAKLIIDVLRHGQPATATILEAEKVESVHSSPSPGDGFDDIYRLLLRVDTGRSEDGQFVITVYQHFRSRARAQLVAGNTVPVRYTPGLGLTVVRTDDSVPWLSSKSFPLFRPLIKWAR